MFTLSPCFGHFLLLEATPLLVLNAANTNFKRRKSLSMKTKWFSNDCLETNTKVITPTNHNGGKQHDEPITILSDYL